MDKSIKIYEKEMQILLSLPKENMADIVTALLQTALGEQPEELEPMNNAVYQLVNSQITRARDLSEKRAFSGKKGMFERWDDNNDITNDSKPITNHNNDITNDNTITNTITNTYTNTKDFSPGTEPAEEEVATLEASEEEPDSLNSEKRENTPIKQIMELYNSVCPKLNAIKNIVGQREKAVKARWSNCKNLETFRTLFEMSNTSDFLCGNNSRNWRADFDWLMKSDNFTKVLEGKYENKPENHSQSPPKTSNPFLNLLENSVVVKSGKERENSG